MLLAYCICCFFFFIILSGFGENLLSHLSSTLEIGEVPEVEAADVNGTGEAHQPDNNHSYILFAVSCVFMHFGSVGSFEPSSLTLFPLCARRPETGLPFHTWSWKCSRLLRDFLLWMIFTETPHPGTKTNTSDRSRNAFRCLLRSPINAQPTQSTKKTFFLSPFLGHWFFKHFELFFFSHSLSPFDSGSELPQKLH